MRTAHAVLSAVANGAQCATYRAAAPGPNRAVDVADYAAARLIRPTVSVTTLQQKRPDSVTDRAQAPARCALRLSSCR